MTMTMRSPLVEIYNSFDIKLLLNGLNREGTGHKGG